MLGGVWDKFKDFFIGILAFIPQFIYFLYACCVSFLDLMQYLIRKLAGLDVYYVNSSGMNENIVNNFTQGSGEAVSGDIITEFFEGILGISKNKASYSALSTVFWSLVVFGCIILVLTTIFAIMKAHFNYDEKKSNPVNIIFNSVKTFFLMAIIPLTCLFGSYLSNILLRTVDNITSSASNMQIEDVYKNSSVNYTTVFNKGTTPQGVETYASYDFFGSAAYTNMTTFSGIMFKISARNANRVRKGLYTASEKTTMGTSEEKWTDFGIFTSTTPDENYRREEIAEMIDFAFANCLTLSNQDISASVFATDSASLTSSYMYFESAVWYLGLHNVKCFSKYNVGLVWYYYNLWEFNFFLAFAGIAGCLLIFGSIIFGLIVRMIQLMCLFLVFPTLVGIGPLDENKAIKEWQKQFLKDFLMAYGAIVGMNISFLLISEFQKIAFFTSSFLNNVMDMVLVIAVLAVLKDIIKVLSNLVGGEDAAAAGAGTMDAAKTMGSNAGGAVLKAANLALKLGGKASFVGKLLNFFTKAADNKKQIKKKSNPKQKRVTQLKAKEKAKRSEIDSEQAASAQDSEEFSKILKANEGKEGSAEAEDSINQYVSDSGQTRAREIYDKLKSDYAAGAAEIDKSGDSASKKAEKKRALSKNLAQQAASEFENTNMHAMNAKDGMAELSEYEEERNTLEEQIRNEPIQRKEERKAGRSRIQNALIDLGGVTLKAVGEITGIRPAWNDNKKKDSKLADGFLSLGQTFFQQAHMTDMYKKTTTEYKYLTKKQKEQKAERDRDALTRALSESARESYRVANELNKLNQEIQRYKVRIQNNKRNN